jgi:PIN domain nuclease of toxin-antitoxin system
MGRYLLDTHIVIWWLAGSDQLTTEVQDIIANEDSEIWVSAAVSWEIAIKRAKGHLTFQGNLVQQMEEQSFLPLSIRHAHTQQVEHLPDIHRDPFDRIQIAQAQIEKLALITYDEMIWQYPGVELFK